jgi:hypothetical protein
LALQPSLGLVLLHNFHPLIPFQRQTFPILYKPIPFSSPLPQSISSWVFPPFFHPGVAFVLYISIFYNTNIPSFKIIERNMSKSNTFLINRKEQYVRVHVLTAASMLLVFWDVAPCSHVEVDRRFRGAYCLHHQGDSSRLHDATSQKTLNFKRTVVSAVFCCFSQEFIQ